MVKKALRITAPMALYLCASPLWAAQVPEEAALLPSDTVSESELAGQNGRGGNPNQLSAAEATATLHDNQLSSGNTGDNVIDGGAFSGMAGIGTVIQNTGNQVVIQGTTAVNVVYTP